MFTEYFLLIVYNYAFTVNNKAYNLVLTTDYKIQQTYKDTFSSLQWRDIRVWRALVHFLKA